MALLKSARKAIIFLSAITDRLGGFDLEVISTQNYAASFNAGIVLGELMCSLNNMVINGFDFKRNDYKINITVI